MFALSNSRGNEIEKDVKYVGGIIKRVSNFDMDTIESRLIFQKTVYMIQAFGIKLGYNFNWYLKGVYCPRLTDVGYKLKEQIDDMFPSKFSDENVEKKFLHFIEFIQPYKNNVTMLEIFTSLHWLKQRNHTLDKDVLIDLLASKKDIDMKAIEEGWDILHKEGIV